LKIKEASYLHAEGFAAGEFRHGSAAILDAATAIVGIVDDPSRAIVERPLDEALRSESLRYTIGADVPGIERLGAAAAEPFNTLAWLVAGQSLALEIGRARGVDSDAPRGLTKYLA
jgi:glucosamine--fructose-6-phosphate aminotransferase (isomerizing)